MAESRIIDIALETASEKTGFFRQKTVTEENLRLRTSGGSIILPEHAVTGAGDSWKLLKSRLYHMAKEKNVPFYDRRKKES